MFLDVVIFLALTLAFFDVFHEFNNTIGSRFLYLLVVIGLLVYGFKILIFGRDIVRDSVSDYLQGRRDIRKARIAAVEKERRKHIADQEAISRTIVGIHQRALSFLKAAPSLVSGAELLVEKTLEDYRDHAYYPFWDKLEQATKLVAEYQIGMNRLSLDIAEFAELTRTLKGRSLPKLPVSPKLSKLLGICKETVSRIKAIERHAHTDFEFSSIYAARKSNNILIAGFQNLSDALQNISIGIDKIHPEITIGFNTVLVAQIASTQLLLDSSKQIYNAIERSSNSANELSSELLKLNKETADRERFVVDALDNIQMKRQPLPDWSLFSKLPNARKPSV